MTAIHHSPTPYPTIYKSDGTKLENGKNGVTLASGTVYYVLIGGEAALVSSFHLQWDAAIILTVTIEDSNNPDVTLYSTTAGEWVQQNPSTAYVGGDGAGGMTVTNWTAAIAGGTAGGGMWHFGNSGAARTRMKLSVGGTGGVIKATTHAKM